MVLDGSGWFWSVVPKIRYTTNAQKKITRLTTDLDPVEVSMLVNIPVKLLRSPKAFAKKTSARVIVVLHFFYKIL